MSAKRFLLACVYASYIVGIVILVVTVMSALFQPQPVVFVYVTPTAHTQTVTEWPGTPVSTYVPEGYSVERTEVGLPTKKYGSVIEGTCGITTVTVISGRAHVYENLSANEADIKRTLERGDTLQVSGIFENSRGMVWYMTWNQNLSDGDFIQAHQTTTPECTPR